MSCAKVNGVKNLEKICCFTGHRNIDERIMDELFSELYKTIEGLAKQGFRIFRAGGAVGFDRLAADAVLALRQKNPEIELHIFVPCLDQNKFFSKEENEYYMAQINSADKIMCISETYTKDCMLMRNRAMVEGADACICYLRRQSGGTAYTVRYAEKQNCRVIRL